ncbi:MAG TPA: hypothetical protein PKM58_01285 [Pyrinomonadaceae bacterium]|nr:hypothetical protein [Pyrinomonadaceae bacterium]
MHDQELFTNYELKTWDYSPRIYKILAFSAIFNILAILVVGQSNLLTRKGCDSPLVGKVCTVIDAVYLGGTVLTTTSRTVDEAYTPTELTSDDEVTFINVADQLTYPEGYFSLANPESALGQDPTVDLNGFGTIDNGTNPIAPGIPNNPTVNPTNPTTKSPLSKPQVLPRQPKGRVVSDLPDDPLGDMTDNPTVNPKDKPTRPRITGTPDPKANANKEAEALKNLDPTNGEVEINRRPLKNLAKKVKDSVGKGMSLTTPFNVQAKGKLTEEGKIDSKNFNFTKSQGDERLVEIVKESVAAISDSGYLQYLKLLSGKNLDLQVTQDATGVNATVQSEMESDTRASSVSTLLSFAIGEFKKKKEKAIAEMQNDPAKAQEVLDEIDDLELLKAASVKTDGKKIVLQFFVPQETAAKLIERKLNAPDTPDEKKPNSAAQIVDKALSAAK